MSDPLVDPSISIDVLIALTAAEESHALLTRDSDFRRIATVVRVELEKI